MKPLAVYVHIPFCTVKCGYCDFNAYAGLDALKTSYMAALLREIEAAGSLLAGRRISSVAFGGGTPGEVPAEAIAALIRALCSPATWDPGEVSLEANPGTLSGDYLRALHRGGVTRLSLGAQSFHVDELAFLDRIHSPEATASAVRLARAAGFASVGLDLIYGLPGQPNDRWLASLGQAISLGPDHISAYALTVEEGTPLGLRVARGQVEPLEADAVADMYEEANEILARAGYRQYELSNWARPGHESRHNLTYWTDGDYLAIGAGAHGYVDSERYENIAHPRRYIEAVAGARPGDARPACGHAYVPGRAMAISDFVSLRLRLVAGLPRADFEARFGIPLEEALGPVLDDCEGAGVLDCDEDGVRLTARGRLLHGEVAARIHAFLDVPPEAVRGRPSN